MLGLPLIATAVAGMAVALGMSLLSGDTKAKDKTEPEPPVEDAPAR